MSDRLIVRPEAEWDIQDGFEWYESQASGLGSEFVRAIDACLSKVGRNPESYPKVYKQVRRAFLRRFPYAVLYVYEVGSIVIIACLHTKRSPKSWQDRL